MLNISRSLFHPTHPIHLLSWLWFLRFSYTLVQPFHYSPLSLIMSSICHHNHRPWYSYLPQSSFMHVRLDTLSSFDSLVPGHCPCQSSFMLQSREVLSLILIDQLIHMSECHFITIGYLFLFDLIIGFEGLLSVPISYQ